MTDANFEKFSTRVQAIEKSHRRRASGFVRLEERDGLLVPVAHPRPRRTLPLRGIALSAAAFLLFKAFLYASLGPLTYTDRVSQLAGGNVVEQMGGWIMQAEPLTRWLGTQALGLF